MRCIRPIKAGYGIDCQTIVYSSKKMNPELAPFEFECRKCLPCRLNMAREKATRAVHEAKMHENNIFLTLTYDEKHLESPRLIYLHWQLFMKSLREKIIYDAEKKINQKLTKEMKNAIAPRYMVTGEYGELNKRPHWHAILFNYGPKDSTFKYTSELGETVYTSETIDKLWKRGSAEFGSVTFESACYVARYAAKKLVHGDDQSHDYHPIHKTSSGRAIGRTWIEENYKHVFTNGFVTVKKGEKIIQTKIPRYYEDWYKKHYPEDPFKYYSEVKVKSTELAERQARKEEIEFLTNIISYKGGKNYPQTRAKVKETILKHKFKRLQEMLKL